MNEVKAVHCFGAYQSLGGVQSILKMHHRNDGRFGVDSRFVIYHEAGDASGDRVRFLDLKGGMSVGSARREFRGAMGSSTADVAIYQSHWGVPYFANDDGAARRILYQHGRIPNLESVIRRRSPFLDGIICNGQAVVDLVRKCAPDLGEERVCLAEYPIELPKEQPQREPLGARPVVIGFAGRISFHQKRVDRMPALFEKLDALGVPYRMEFMGDGSERAWLEERLSDRTRFVFHGVQTGSDYWRILKGWDMILFTSDFEGTPVAMLEAMSAGVLPLYPEIESGAEPYVEAVDRGLLYPVDDSEAASAAVQRICSMPTCDVDALRERARAKVAHHSDTYYFDRFAVFLRKIVALPRVSRERAILPTLMSPLTFRQLEKLGGIRSFLKR